MDTLPTLGGEPVPADLAALLARRDELYARTGITLDPGGEPWNDTSYLTPADLANREIAANVQAMRETNTLVAWIAAHEDGEYLGYWRGPEGRAVADSPVVCLDNEGQYVLLPGGFAAALLDLWSVDAEELAAWYAEIGLEAGPSTAPADRDEVDAWRNARYEAIVGG